MKHALALVLLLVPLCSSAQSVTRKGSVATLDVASWNVEQFQNRDPQMANVVRVMQQAGIDLWALQEVTAPAVLDHLLTQLGDDWDGRLSTSTNLYTAFVFRTDIIQVRSAGPMFSNNNFDYAFAGRRPFLLEANVTLPDTTLQATFITLHMKCCSDSQSWERRRDAASAIKNRIDFLHPSERIVVLGDFNDETEGSITFGRESPYKAFVDDPEYNFLVDDPPGPSVGTFCGSNSSCETGSTIDNVMISSELHQAYIGDTGDRYSELLSEVDRYVFTTSDHLPVLARFAFASSTAIAPELPGRPAPTLWPVPARGQAQVDTGGLPAEIVVRDLLGRTVSAFRHDGHEAALLDLSRLAPGLYLVEVRRQGVPFHLTLPVSR